ncbi:hypothetical protein V8B97DRAFT_1915075 [Scleroderma yunnanense]
MAHAKQVYKYRSLISYVQGMGGIRTHAGADSARSRAHIYHNQRVYTIHAPTSAPALLHILNLIEWYNLSEKSGTGLNMHWLVKPLKCERKFNNLSDTSLLSRSKVAFVYVILNYIQIQTWTANQATEYGRVHYRPLPREVDAGGAGSSRMASLTPSETGDTTLEVLSLFMPHFGNADGQHFKNERYYCCLLIVGE